MFDKFLDYIPLPAIPGGLLAQFSMIMSWFIRLPLIFLIVSGLGCATGLEYSKSLVLDATGVPDTKVQVVLIDHGNFYSPDINTIFLNDVGMKNGEIQIHEYLHWAFEQLTYNQRTELFALWGTYYIYRHRR